MKYIKKFEVKNLSNDHVIYNDGDVKLLNYSELKHFNTRKYNQGDFVKLKNERQVDKVFGVNLMVYKVLGFSFGFSVRGGRMYSDIIYSIFYLDDNWKGWSRLDELLPATIEEKELCELQMSTNKYNL